MITRYCGTAHCTVIDENEAGVDLVLIRPFLLSYVQSRRFCDNEYFQSVISIRNQRGFVLKQ